MTKISGYPSASTPGGTEVFPVTQGGVTKKMTIQQVWDGVLTTVRGGVAAAYDTLSELQAYAAGIGSSLTAHLAQTDPFVHSADKVSYTGTVVGADVAEALDALNSAKADNGSVAGLVALSASGATVNKNNSSVEETLISFALPANTLDTNGEMLIVEASGDIINAAGVTFIWRFKNGTVVAPNDADALTAAVGTSQHRWKLRASIRRLTLNSQALAVSLEISAPGVSATQVIEKSYVGSFTDFAATDFAASAGTTVAVTVQMSAAATTNRVRMYGYDAYKVAA